MALASYATWEVRTGGNDANGGAFNPNRGGGGVDRSQQDAAHVVIDGGAVSAVAGPTSGQNITLTGYTVSSADLGNHVKIASAWYEITAVNTGGNYWTLDRTTGASVDSAVTGNMGGAVASLGGIAASAVTGNRVYVKSGTYTLTSGTTNVSGGLAFFTGTNIALIGYDATRDADPGSNRPLIVCPSSITTPTNGVIRINGNSTRVAWLVVQIADTTLSTLRGFQNETSSTAFYRCKAICGNTSQIGFNSAGTWGIVEECETNGIISRAKCIKSVARLFNFTSSELSIGCIATEATSTNTGLAGDPGVAYVGCVAAMSRCAMTRSCVARLCYANSFVLGSTTTNNGGERFAECISPNAFPTLNGYNPQSALRSPEQLTDNSVDANAIFTNPAAGDYRLTAYGLTLPRARFIAACISGCPGVTTDSLATLMSASRSTGELIR